MWIYRRDDDTLVGRMKNELFIKDNKARFWQPPLLCVTGLVNIINQIT